MKSRTLRIRRQRKVANLAEYRELRHLVDEAIGLQRVTQRRERRLRALAWGVIAIGVVFAVLAGVGAIQ